MYYDFFYADTTDLQHIIIDNIFDSVSKTVLLFDQGKGNEYHINTHLSIIDEKCISDYLPATKCPKFLNEVKSFSLEATKWSQCAEYISNWLKTKAVIIKKSSYYWVEVQPINSPFLRFEGMDNLIQKEHIIKLKQCSLKYWWCKPTTMITSSLISKTAEKLEIVALSDKINTLKVFNYDYDFRYEWSSYFKDILKQLKNNKKLKVTTQNWKMRLLYNCSGAKFKIQSWALVFIHDCNVLPIKYDFSLVEIEGILRGLTNIGNDQYAAIDVWSLKSDKFNIQYDSKSEALTNENIEKLQKLNKQGCYHALFKVKNIREIETSYSTKISIVIKSSNLMNINIIYNWENYDLSTLMSDLSWIPKCWGIEFYKYNIQAYLLFDNEINEFFKAILEFSKVTFKTNWNKLIQIKGTIENINEEDIKNCRFKIFIGGYEEVVSYRILLILLNSY